MGLPLTRIAFPSYTENVPDLIHKGNQIRSYSQRKSDRPYSQRKSDRLASKHWLSIIKGFIEFKNQLIKSISTKYILTLTRLILTS
jgi:hypothetical protein